MAKTLLEKMFYKPTHSSALLHIPQNLKNEFETNNKADSVLKEKYNFILAFYSKKEDLKKEISELKNALSENALLWIAYPKAKLLGTDLNRDTLHELLAAEKLDGVSLISLNDTWSTMRFKQL